ncbi:MAG: glycerophosphodiester phosphodiesterase family protein [Gammaproteobacteria bacterium]
MTLPLIIGHRGAAGLQPENTLASIDAALALGVDMIEVDVHLVEDELVVFHDFRLERLVGQSGRLSARSLKELAQFRVCEQKIPTLSEVAMRMQGVSKLNIEIKGKGCAIPMVTAFQNMLANKWCSENIIVSSFDHTQLATLKALVPSMNLGLLMECQPVEYAQSAERFGAYSLHTNYESLSQAYLEDAHARGLKVFVYTVNYEDDMRDLIVMGVDGIITDYPDRLRAVILE